MIAKVTVTQGRDFFFLHLSVQYLHSCVEGREGEPWSYLQKEFSVMSYTPFAVNGNIFSLKTKSFYLKSKTKSRFIPAFITNFTHIDFPFLPSPNELVLLLSLTYNLSILLDALVVILIRFMPIHTPLRCADMFSCTLAILVLKIPSLCY